MNVLERENYRLAAPQSIADRRGHGQCAVRGLVGNFALNKG